MLHREDDPRRPDLQQDHDLHRKHYREVPGKSRIRPVASESTWSRSDWRTFADVGLEHQKGSRSAIATGWRYFFLPDFFLLEAFLAVGFFEADCLVVAAAAFFLPADPLKIWPQLAEYFWFEPVFKTVMGSCLRWMNSERTD